MEPAWHAMRSRARRVVSSAKGPSQMWPAPQTGPETVNLNRKIERLVMLGWSLTFLIVALLAAFLGFAGIAGTAAWIAKVSFLIFLALFVCSLFFGRKAKT